MSTLSQALATVLKKEFTLALRRLSDVLNPLVFFAIVAALFPLGVGPEPNMLRTMAPGVIWVAALLATLLSLPRLFAADYEDGSIELLILSPHPLTVLVAAKILSHWLLTGLPLLIVSPLLAMQLQLDETSTLILMFSLLLGTPILSLLGAVGAALTLGLRGGGVLVSLLVLPLYTPVLIFGAGAVAATSAGHSAEGFLSLLAALLVLAVFFLPYTAAAALRVSLD